MPEAQLWHCPGLRLWRVAVVRFVLVPFEMRVVTWRLPPLRGLLAV